MNAGVASSQDEAVPRNTPHRAQTLSRTTSREVSESQARRDALFFAASQLKRCAGDTPLAELMPDQDLAMLVDALADEHDSVNGEAPRLELTFDIAHDRLLAALDGAIPAVRTCRQTAHPVNTCWFLTASTHCGDVLKSAHQHAR